MSETAVCLQGAPRIVGRLIGQAQKDSIASELKRLWKAETALRGPAEALRALLEKEAPAWVAETQAMAEAAGVDPWAMFELASAPYTKPAYVSTGECTSALAMGDVTSTGRPIVFKIRDERPKPQYVAIRHVDGSRRVLYGSNVLNLGVAYALNDAGFAIANNTGSPITDPEDAPGFDDCLLTRLLAEQCATCEDAIARVAVLCRRGAVRGAGWRKGSILLMADATGQGAVVEIARREWSVLRMKKGFAAVANHFIAPESRRFENAARLEEPPCRSSFVRRSRLEALMREALARGPLPPADFERFAADRANHPFSLCNPTGVFPWRTLGAFVFVLGDKPAARFCVGPASHAPFQSLAISDGLTPLALLRGAWPQGEA
ncbi:MAG TPA: C45 family autoproteolytic acyltransferase/hydrolase [Candidatus Brocadiia bacterium]|nr:C45 family autoproteolytic acyltransferase/hydrolase [Candidatus Brocadiia bacterium]